MSGVWVAWPLLWGEDWKELGEEEAGQKLGSTFLPCEGPGWAVVTVVSIVSSPAGPCVSSAGGSPWQGCGSPSIGQGGNDCADPTGHRGSLMGSHIRVWHTPRAWRSPCLPLPPTRV